MRFTNAESAVSGFILSFSIIVRTIYWLGCKSDMDGRHNTGRIICEVVVDFSEVGLVGREGWGELCKTAKYRRVAASAQFVLYGTFPMPGSSNSQGETEELRVRSVHI
jgi:hypothetical protein